MWIRQNGLLCHTETKCTLSPQSYGQPIYFEHLGELYFSAADVVLKMSVAEFSQFSQEYEIALQP